MFGRVFLRRFSSLAEPLQRGKGRYPVPNNSTYRKLMEKQTLFCRDDGLLVWQKLPSDMLLYRAMIVVVGFGTLLSLDTLRRMAAPPKNT